MNEAINTIVGVFSGIIGSSGNSGSASENRYNRPVFVSESKMMPTVYIYLAITAALLLFAVFAATAKK